VDDYSITEFTVPARIVRIECPRRCGWYRAYTKTGQWMSAIIDHPLYGLLTQQELVNLEVQSHDCIEARNAKIRLMNRRARNVREAAAA
jgi:hypothetical protein